MELYTYYYYQGRANIILRHILTYVLLSVIPLGSMTFSFVTKSDNNLFYIIPSIILVCLGFICFITSIIKWNKFTKIKLDNYITDVTKMEWHELVNNVSKNSGKTAAQIINQITQKSTIYTILYSSNVNIPDRDYGLWLFDNIFNMIQPDGTLNIDGWENRHLWICLLAIMLTPVALIYIVVKHISSAFNMIQTTPSLLTARIWNTVRVHKFRDLNEVDHLFEARLFKAYSIAEEIFESTSSPIYSTLATIVFILLGSVCLPLGYLMISGSPNSIVIATFTTLIACLNMVSKMISTKTHLVIEPEQIKKLSLLLHFPIDDLNQASELLAQTTEYRVIGWLRDVLDVIITPWYLLFSRYYLKKISLFISERIDTYSLITDKVPDYKIEQSKIGSTIYEPREEPYNHSDTYAQTYGEIHDSRELSLYVPPPYNPQFDGVVSSDDGD